MNNRAVPVIHARYKKNRTRTGRPSSSKAIQGIYYHGYGTAVTNPNKVPRGYWYDENGQVVAYGNVVNWVKEQAKAHTYTYQLMLSLRDGSMQGEDFVSALKAGTQAFGEFAEFRLIVHRDTEHCHAHVTAFRDTVIKKSDLQKWRLSVSAQLEQAETKRLTEQSQQAEQSQPYDSGMDIDF